MSVCLSVTFFYAGSLVLSHLIGRKDHHPGNLYNDLYLVGY